MDKAALLKTIQLLEAEIETLSRARNDLIKQLGNDSTPLGTNKRTTRGSVKRFMQELMSDGNARSLSEIVLLVEKRDLPFRRGSLKMTLNRGVDDGIYSKQGDTWILASSK